MIIALHLLFLFLRKFKLKKSIKKIPVWSTACRGTSSRSCDLTQFNLYYLGSYVLRVEANVNGHFSDWVQKEFCPDKDGKREGVGESRAGDWDQRENKFR